MSSRVILGLCLLVTVFGTAVFVIMHGHPMVFWDRASLLIVGGGTLSFLLINFPAEEILKNIRLAMSRGNQATRADLTRAVGFFDTAVRASLMFGVISVFVGVMMALVRLDDPRMIAPAAAHSLLGMLYGIVLGEGIFQSMRIQCSRKLEAGEAAPPAPPGGQGLVASLLFVFIGMVPLVIVLLLVLTVVEMDYQRLLKRW